MEYAIRLYLLIAVAWIKRYWWALTLIAFIFGAGYFTGAQ